MPSGNITAVVVRGNRPSVPLPLPLPVPLPLPLPLPGGSGSGSGSSGSGSGWVAARVAESAVVAAVVPVFGPVQGGTRVTVAGELSVIAGPLPVDSAVLEPHCYC
jgi:hypothetical protein